MYEVATRQMPERTVLCLKRHVAGEPEVWDLSKQFLAYFRERPRPLLSGRRGAPYLIYHGEVSADSDGPVEFCRPIPTEDAAAMAAQSPSSSCASSPLTKRPLSISVPTEPTPTSGPSSRSVCKLGPSNTIGSRATWECGSPTCSNRLAPPKASPTSTSPCR